jgi:hypothetical protein
MVLECQQHPDYAQAIETLLDLAEEYGGHSRAIAQGGTGTVKEARGGLSAAEDDLKVRMGPLLGCSPAHSEPSTDAHREIRQRDIDRQPLVCH